MKVELIDDEDQVVARGTVEGNITPHAVRWGDELYTFHASGVNGGPTRYRVALVLPLEEAEVLAPAPPA